MGIFPSDFENYFQLSSAWISPSSHSMLVWKYERDKEPKNGNFIHAGALLGSASAIFSQHGYVFVKRINADLTMGLFLNEIISEIPLKRMGKKVEIDQNHKIPSNIPVSAFRFIHRIKRKNVLVIDPLMLFKAFDVI